MKKELIFSFDDKDDSYRFDNYDLEIALRSKDLILALYNIDEAVRGVKNSEEKSPWKKIKQLINRIECELEEFSDLISRLP